ncbi:hypothetical protein [Algicola sagamiensis]|uniref:hypothetical protein n=1 Tax=Algicola sagamiensis TaxID=163869 RepID=UPI000382AA7F|nr:hypothetical protein [Algicola sagamiensis]
MENTKNLLNSTHRFFFGLILLIWAEVGVAHSAFISFYRLEHTPQELTLVVSLAQATVVTQFNKKEGAPPFQHLSGEEQKQKLVFYLQSHIHLYNVNSRRANHRLDLKLKHVDIGQHETTVVFEIEKPPKMLEGMQVTIDAFANGANHHNIVHIIKMGQKKRLILSNKNQFQAVL